MKERGVADRPGIYEDDIGRRTRCQGSGAGTERPGTCRGRHVDRFSCGKQGRRVPGELLQEGCKLHLLKKVEAVVGGAAVCPEGDVRPVLLQPAVGHGPVDGKLHVACRVVGDGDAPFSKEPALGLVEPAAVRGDGSGGEAPAFVEKRRRAFAELRDAVDDLFLGLGEVGVDADPLFFGKAGAPGETFRRDGVDGVGADGRLDTRVIEGFYVGDEGFRRSYLGLPLLLHPEVDEPVGEGRPDAHIADRLRRPVHEEVHIVERDRAAPDHLKAGKLRPGVDIVAGKMGLKRPYLLREPLRKRHIVPVAAQKGHSGVGMGVDETGDRQTVGTVDDYIGVMLASDSLSNSRDSSCLIYSDIHGRSVDGGPGDQHGSPCCKYVV